MATKKKPPAPEVATVATPERAEDDAQKSREYAEHLAEKSRVDLFRKQLSAPLPEYTARAVRDRLDDVVGPGGWSLTLDGKLDNWSVTLSILCVCGVGRSTASRSVPVLRDVTFEDGFLAAAEMFGIGIDGPLSKSPATAATPVKDKLKEMTPPAEHGKVDALNGKSYPEPKKEEAKPARKPDNFDTWEAVKKDWLNKLGACVTPDDLNAMLPGARGVPTEFKKPLFDMLKDNANVAGWAWDKDNMRFYDTRPDDTVPF